MPRISSDEYRHRLETLQASIRCAGLDVFIVTSFDSIYYLTGAGFEPLERPFFLLVRPECAPHLLVPKLDQEHMKKAHGIDAACIHTYWDYPSPAGRGWSDRLVDEIGSAREIGVEPATRQEIAHKLRSYPLRTEPLVERLRLIKSDAEIQMIRRAAQYADFGVERLLAASYLGSSVGEGFAETRTVNLQIIREVPAWEAVTTKVVMATWAAPRSAMPHSIPNLNDRLWEGPHVALVLTRVNGYAAECERTYFTTQPSAAMRQAFAAMMEARAIAFRMIRPGVRCDELDATVNEFLRNEGYGSEEQRLHRTGHGFGLCNHEAPWIAEGSQERLAENMVISVEPGIYLPGIGGVRHSETVLITKHGHELLTHHPMDLCSLMVRGWKPLTRLKGKFVRRALRTPHCAAGL